LPPLTPPCRSHSSPSLSLTTPSPSTISPLSLHDALPISVVTNKTPNAPYRGAGRPETVFAMDRIVDCLARELRMDPELARQAIQDRKSTRLNSSHRTISYAVFCLKKKKKQKQKHVSTRQL